MYQKKDLIRHNKMLGIPPSDTFMVHTFLKSIGTIDPDLCEKNEILNLEFLI